MTTGLALVLAALAFTVSAAAGLGGSLLLVPGLALLFGVREGITLSAILLACNNIAKLVAYRQWVPWRKAVPLLILTVVGAWTGASLLLRVPEELAQVAVILCILAVFVADRVGVPRLRRPMAAALALGAGSLSGFAGTSGPLKGLALRSLSLDRMHLVGAATVLSLVGDATKALVLVPAVSLSGAPLMTIAGGVVLAPVATLAGRQLNQAMGERAYSGLFWLVMTGYAVRLLAR